MAAASEVLDLPVSFKGVSFGDKTARVGVALDRTSVKLKLSDFDKNLCDKRLTGTIKSKPSETDGQGRLEGFDGLLEVNGTFDVKGFKVSSNSIDFGLTFSLKDLDRATFSEFAKVGGRLIVTGVEDIPEDAVDEEEDDEEDEAAETSKAAASGADEAWKSEKVRDALKGLGKRVYDGIDKLLGGDGEPVTLGALFEWKNGGGGSRWWTNIDGVGEAAATKIDDAIEAFWTKWRKRKPADA